MLAKERLVKLEKEDLVINGYLIREDLILIIMSNSLLIYDDNLNLMKEAVYRY